MYNSKLYIESIKKIAKSLPVKSSKVLITGASGLIGSCLVDVFAQANKESGANYDIYAISRSREKMSDLFPMQDNLHIIAQNITEQISIDGIEYIIHAASNADPRSYALYPVETILTNVQGTKNVLEYCLKNNARALLTSSFEVYGKRDADEFKESDYGIIDLDLLRSCYPESKRTAEMLVKSYCDEYNVDAVIVRLASIYGPTMQKDDSKAHAQFLRNASNGQNIVLKSRGTQKRTYCYVMDAVSGILAVLFNGIKGETYNVANSQSVVTIAELAGIIANLTRTQVVFKNPDLVEAKGYSRPQNCVLNTDKIRSIGWNASYSLKEGVTETIEIMRQLK